MERKLVGKLAKFFTGEKSDIFAYKRVIEQIKTCVGLEEGINRQILQFVRKESFQLLDQQTPNPELIALLYQMLVVLHSKIDQLPQLQKEILSSFSHQKDVCYLVVEDVLESGSADSSLLAYIPASPSFLEFALQKILTSNTIQPNAAYYALKHFVSLLDVENLLATSLMQQILTASQVLKIYDVNSLRAQVQNKLVSYFRERKGNYSLLEDTTLLISFLNMAAVTHVEKNDNSKMVYLVLDLSLSVVEHIKHSKLCLSHLQTYASRYEKVMGEPCWESVLSYLTKDRSFSAEQCPVDVPKDLKSYKWLSNFVPLLKARQTNYFEEDHKTLHLCTRALLAAQRSSPSTIQSI